MSLLMILFLLNTTAVKPLGYSDSTDLDSLETKENVVTPLEGGESMLEYSYGMDTYSVGFNKNSISTNTVKENIDVSSGQLSLNIKLASLPMRGNETYDVYLTYRGSPLSLFDVSGGEQYSWSNSYGLVGDDFLVTGDIGTCGLGWNVMPGEFSVPGDPLYARGSSDPGDLSFTRINGNSYTTYAMGGKGWHVLGKEDWTAWASYLRASVITPQYEYMFEKVLPYGAADPLQPDIDQRILFMLTEMEDKNGNYVRFTWHDCCPANPNPYLDTIPPAGRIPEEIITPTTTCEFYRREIDPIDDTKTWWKKFYLIDRLERSINGGNYVVNFYYTEVQLSDAIEYYYNHESVLLDSISFYYKGEKVKPSYKFSYDENTGELVEFITPEGAKYEYEYETVEYWRVGVTKYRRIRRKKVTLPEDSETLSYLYLYEGGTDLAESSVGELESREGEWTHGEGSTDPWSFYSMYKKCQVIMPEGDKIVYWNINDEYLEEHYKCYYEGDEQDVSRDVPPKTRKFFYGKPYKIVKIDDDNGPLELERLYWAVDSIRAEFMPRNILRPTLRYKAIKKDPSEDYTIEIGDTIKLYEYDRYDRFGNKKEYSYFGDVEYSGTEWESISFDYLTWDLFVDRWDNEKIIYSEIDEDDNWKVKQNFKHENHPEYIKYEKWCEECNDGEGEYIWVFRMLVHLPTSIKKYNSDELIGRTEIRYDETDLEDVFFPGIETYHNSEDFPVDSTTRGNLTKKTEYIKDDETRFQEYWYDICGNLVEMEDYTGEKYEFEYDDELAVFPWKKFYPKDGLIEKFTFSFGDGNLKLYEDKNNVLREFEYDCFGRLISDELGGNLLSEYQYNDFDRIAKVISYSSDISLDTAIYYYDNLGRLEVEEVCGENNNKDVIKNFYYDGNGRLFEETVPRFRNASKIYSIIKDFDYLGRVTEIEYPSDGEDEYVEYFYDGYITDVKDEEGCYTTLINDASGNLVKVVDALYVDDTTFYDYDVNGNLLKITDTEEKEIDFEYDWLGNLIRREGPDRGVDIFEYDANGNTKFHKNNSGDEIGFEYDELGRITSKIINNTEVETYDYDSYTPPYTAPSLDIDYPEGRLTGFENPNVKEVYFYDKFGRLGEKWVVLDPLSLPPEDVDTFKYSYDLKGRVTRLKYPGDYKVEYAYDNFDNISLVEINDGEPVTFSSTAAGLLSGIHFPGGVTDTFKFEPRNWMREMEINGIPNWYQRRFEYNKRGELNRIWYWVYSFSASEIQEMEYTYDSLGRLTSEDRREGTENDYWFTYDKVGNRTSVNGVDYYYFNEDGKTNKLKDDGEFEYTYDGNGYISSKIDGNDTVKFYYDPEGRLIGVSDEDNNGYKYYYKGHQRIREEKLTDIVHNQTAEGFSYSCDLKSDAIAEAKLIAVFLDENNDSIGNKKLAEINGTYNDWLEFSGNIPKEEFPSGTVSLKLKVKRSGMSPDGHLWVGDMSMGKLWEDGGISGDTVQASNYFYDNAGNLILVKSLGSGTAANVVQNPGFETGDLSNWYEYFPDYTYGWVTDGYGSYSPYEGEYLLLTWGYDESYIYQEIPISESVSSPITISCWVKSNLIREGGFVIKGVLKDADGIHIEEHSSAPLTESCDWTKVSLTIGHIPEGTSSCEIILMRMDGYSTVAIDNVVCELETEQMTETKYIYAGNRLLAKEEDEELHFYHLDRLGSPIMITDESGEVVKEKQYEAFGNLIWAEGTLEDNREFTGKEKDPTGFHYFGARYYYGNIGRFLSPDPHTVMPGNIDLSNPQELNPYVYCVNDPLEYVDPNGKYYVWAWDFAINKTAAKGVPSSEIGLFLRDNTVPAVISGKGGLDAEVPFVKTLRPNIFKMDNQIEYLNYGPYTEIEGVGKRPFMSYQAAPGRGGLPMEVGAITKTGDTEKGTGKSIFEVQLETKVQNGWRRNDITLEREPKYDYQTNVTLTGTKDTFRSQGYEIYEDKDHPNNYGIRELQ